MRCSLHSRKKAATKTAYGSEVRPGRAAEICVSRLTQPTWSRVDPASSASSLAYLTINSGPSEVELTFHLVLVFRQRVGADDSVFFQVTAAVKTGRVIDVSRAV